MKIVIIGHTYVVAANQIKINLLAQKKLELLLIVPSVWKHRNDLFADLQAKPVFPYTTFSVKTVPVFRSGHIASYLFSPIPLLWAIQSFKPDIIYVEQEVYSLVAGQASLIAKILNKRLIIFGWENHEKSLYLVQRLCKKITLKTASTVICGNQKGAMLVRKWGFKSQINIIPQLGVDPNTFSLHNKPPKVIKTIGYVGRLVHEKGVDVLFNALSLLQKDFLQFKVLICGDGLYIDYLKKMAEEINISQYINWQLAVLHDKVPEIMSQIDILVLPSRSIPSWKEQFGLVLAQAMSMGIPVIGSDCGAIPEVIGKDELIFHEEDYRSLASLLKKMIMDENYYQKISRYGVLRSRQNFTNDIIVEKLLKLFYSTKIGNQITMKVNLDPE